MLSILIIENLNYKICAQKCFNFVDRGVIFKVVQKYMGLFQGNMDNQVIHLLDITQYVNNLISVVVRVMAFKVYVPIAIV